MPKFVPRERKHKVRQRLAQQGGENGANDLAAADPNAVEILPSSEKEKKKQELKTAIQAQQPKISGKKKKRLDKYIDKKLQKEENLDLIKKLANARVDTSLMRSSRSLGGNRPKREVLAQALKETRAGLNLDSNRKLLYEHRDEEDDSSESSDELHSVEPSNKGSSAPQRPTLGSGLKRSLDGDNTGNPIIKKRQRLSVAKSLSAPESEMPWDGFSSDESEPGMEPFQTPQSTTLSIASQTDSEEHDSGSDTDQSAIDDSSEGSEAEIQLSDHEKKSRKDRSSAFKAWATDQVNEALGFTSKPSMVEMSNTTTPKNHPLPQLRPPEQDPLPPELQVSNNERQAYHVIVARSPAIQEARLGLPVVSEEQKIMEAIHNNPTVVIWGATGSGKTTQVPQFLYEAGYGSPDGPNPGTIGVTQPRRVAAVSMAKRVGEELGPSGDSVSYQIRFDTSVSDKTAIKFMTDGILIREIANDFALRKYSAIIIDEAHERSANTDILIGMLSRIVDRRAAMSKEDRMAGVKPLKLVIMSATLRVRDFLNNPNLFRNGPPPLVQAEGRQYPVITHFARTTEMDYLEEAFIKVFRAHKKLPRGGMLVFLTGQNEILTLANRLEAALTHTQPPYLAYHNRGVAASEDALETEDMELENDDDEADTFGHEGYERSSSGNGIKSAPSGVHVLPLYSQLPTKEQLRVFEPPPNDARLIVLATNVAETSLTIPSIRYVFDTGRAKEKKFDRFTGVQSFEVGWISKASASQRAGRAGRTGPGHCYRLYSSAIYERDFEEHAEPEILRMPVEGIVLQLKSMHLQHVVNFPFPTPPDRQSIAKAEKLLSYLGAVSSDNAGEITTIGRDISRYPLSPRLAKMLSIGHQHGCMPFTIALVAALATPNIFILENQLDLSALARGDYHTNDDYQAEQDRTKLLSEYNHAHHLFSLHSPTSDALKALTALCAYSDAPNKDDFCNDRFLSPKSLNEATNLRSQLITIVHNNNPTIISSNLIPKLSKPSTIQFSALQQITAAAYIDQIAILHSASPSPPDLPRRPKRAIDVPYLPLFPITTGRRGPDTDIIDTTVFIHPSSVLSHLAVKDLPTYIVYSHLQRGSSNAIEGGKKPRTRMHALCAVTGKQIAGLARGTPLLMYGKPIGKIEEVPGEGQKVRKCWVVPSLVGERGGLGWPLPAVKVVQRRNERGDWSVEKVVG